MPRERMTWVPQVDMAGLNARMRRFGELTEGSTRYDVRRMTASGVVTLSWPHTLVDVDTTGGSVTVTLPPAATVVGYCVQVAKVVAANTLTVDAHASETISGSATQAWTDQWETRTLVSTGTDWRIV